MRRIVTKSAFAIILALVLAASVASAAFAQSPADARSALFVIESTYEEQRSEFDAALRDYDALTARIEALKQSARVFWDAAELDTLLREQEEAADALMERDRALAELAAEVAAASERLAEELRADVSRLEAEIVHASPLDRARIASELNEVTREIGDLGEPLPPHAPVPLDAITARTENSADELYAASDELTDHEARLERQLADVRQRLADARASARLLRSESEFSSIESLLEDDGSRRIGSRGASAQRGAVTDADRDAEVTSAVAQEDLATESDPTDDRGGMGEEAAAWEPPPAAEGPSFDESDSDGVVSGGSDPTIGFGAEPLSDTPAEATRVEAEVDGLSSEPDRIDDPRRVRSGRRGSAVDILSEREQTLLDELESVRAERERLLERARELDRQ